MQSLSDNLKKIWELECESVKYKNNIHDKLIEYYRILLETSRYTDYLDHPSDVKFLEDSLIFYVDFMEQDYNSLCNTAPDFQVQMELKYSDMSLSPEEFRAKIIKDRKNEERRKLYQRKMSKKKSREIDEKNERNLYETLKKKYETGNI